ncbi:hypothetical protein [Cerasicoccus arenae]|uniref:Uncharacterized protein n=1 Tax=Cerasicoccus arenae TaxID=424488 RepID=A0A8J3DGP9_9BACT|nr:hypothetical protein [Cerasicoccus arenae]MBK1856808.1 hypothetical protein [Cerasicoccus arenae]GHB99641.1 hypothetical protein GCM10007047_14910 [Cerasicoccus arenae]
MSDKFVKNILDVPGVEGVCVFDREGQIVENELPSFFIDELFEDLARRVISLYETVDENYIPCDDYLLKYSERWIFLRRGNGVYFLIFANSEVNRISLKMVTNMAIKNVKSASKTLPTSAARITPAVPAPTRTPTLPPATPTQAAPTPASEPKEEEVATDARKRVARPRPSRSYRGSSY